MSAEGELVVNTSEEDFEHWQGAAWAGILLAREWHGDAMQNLGQFRYLQPGFFAGLLDDPLLFINVRPTGRGILIDCGQLHHLAKRVLRSIDALFISHAHMDHLMGFDHLLRNILVAPRTIAVYGPAGIADRISHKLAGYDWNLAEDNWCTIEVYEVQPRQVEQFEFAGSHGFTLRHRQTLPRRDRTLYQTRHLKVEAEICDHKIPVLIFKVTEAQPFMIDRQRLQAEKLLAGPWIKVLEKRFHENCWEGGAIEVWEEVAEDHTVSMIDDAEALYQKICRDVSPASIGYICDIGMTHENLSQVSGLLSGITLLVSECTFLAEDEEKARISAHLCTTDLNQISLQLKPRFLLPMHLSKSYLKDTHRLYAELDPPQVTQLLQLPDYVTPRPLLLSDLPPPPPVKVVNRFSEVP